MDNKKKSIGTVAYRKFWVDKGNHERTKKVGFSDDEAEVLHTLYR